MNKNKQWKLTAMTALSAFCLLSCEQDLSTGLSAINDNEICITASVEEVSTRATGSTFQSNDKIGVYVVEYTGDNATKGELANGTYKNHPLTYNNSKWTGDAMYWQSEKQVDVIGYYPYNAAVSDASAYPWTIESNQSEQTNFLKGDFLWAMKTTKPRSNEVPLLFSHRMSKIVINYSLGDGFTSFPTNRTITVKTKNGLSSTINLKTGEVVAATPQSDYQVYTMNETANPEAGIELRQQAIVLPQTLKAGDEFITVTSTDFGTFKYVIPSEMVLKSATQYTFNLKLTKGGLEVTVGDITDWTRPDGSISNGSATAVVAPYTAKVDDGINTYWDRISVTNKEEVLIHYGDANNTTDNTTVYFKPEGNDKGYTIVYNDKGYPDKLVTGKGDNNSQTVAIFVPSTNTTTQEEELGVGLIVAPGNEGGTNILMDKIAMPDNFLNDTGTEAGKIKDIIDAVVNLVKKNNLTETIPPASFGQDSELLENLLAGGSVAGELEETTTTLPNYTGVPSDSGTPGSDTSVNDAINTLIAAGSGGGSGSGGSLTQTEATNHLTATETASTTGVTEAETTFAGDIQMIVSGVQGGFGDVKITLTWDTTGDVDLYLKDPAGHIIYYGEYKESPCDCGGSLDIDNQNGFSSTSTSSNFNKPENIFYPEGSGKTGTYNVKVHNYDSNTSQNPKNYTLYIYAFGRTKTYKGEFTVSKEKHYYQFTVNGPSDVTFTGKVTNQTW